MAYPPGRELNLGYVFFGNGHAKEFLPLIHDDIHSSIGQGHTVSYISYEILIFSTLRRKLLGGFKMFLNMPILTVGHIWSKENLK